MAWDFYINGQGRYIGSVSSATHRPEDLVKSFSEELTTVKLVVPSVVHEARAWMATAVDWQSYVWDDRPEVQDACDDDLGNWWLDRGHSLAMELQDALNYLAPEGYRFGTHEGDGADFGWWKVENDEDEVDHQVDFQYHRLGHD